MAAWLGGHREREGLSMSTMMQIVVAHALAEVESAFDWFSFFFGLNYQHRHGTCRKTAVRIVRICIEVDKSSNHRRFFLTHAVMECHSFVTL